MRCVKKAFVHELTHANECNPLFKQAQHSFIIYTRAQSTGSCSGAGGDDTGVGAVVHPRQVRATDSVDYIIQVEM